MARGDDVQIGNYVLLLELATGGMATVYIGKQAGAAGFERLVIIKRVHRHLLHIREFHEMFFDEARVASLIRHPNVVSVDDVVESENELFLVQPYVESVSLARLIEAARDRGEKLPPNVVVRIIADALAGLSAAHEAVDMRGEPLFVVHRDVSPHNILVGTDGRSRIIDFGIAKAARRITTTSGGTMKGKLAYMSPEQARQQPIDARSDLFAMGAVLHETLTGLQLFRAEDQADVILNVLIAEIPPPSSLATGVPPTLDAVVKKALEREPKDRYQTGADLLESLEKALTPAQGREVSQVVDRLCGKELESRREAIRGSLDQPRSSRIPRLSVTSIGKNDATLPGDVGSDGSGRRSKSDVTMAATQAGKGPSPAARQTARRVALFVGMAALGLVLGASAVRLVSTSPPVPATASASATVSVPVSATVSATVPASASAPAPATATVPTTVPASASASAQPRIPPKPTTSGAPTSKPSTGLKPNPFK